MRHLAYNKFIEGALPETEAAELLIWRNKMTQIYSLQYSMETGSVLFGNQEIDMKEEGKPFFNEVMTRDLYIEIFFPAQDESFVKNTFIDCLEDFSSAVILVNKYSKNPYDCDFSENEIKHIKRIAYTAIDSFLEKLVNFRLPSTLLF